jgi:hypothetical protein
MGLCVEFLGRFFQVLRSIAWLVVSELPDLQRSSPPRISSLMTFSIPFLAPFSVESPASKTVESSPHDLLLSHSSCWIRFDVLDVSVKDLRVITMASVVNNCVTRPGSVVFLHLVTLVIGCPYMCFGSFSAESRVGLLSKSVTSFGAAAISAAESPQGDEALATPTTLRGFMDAMLRVVRHGWCGQECE